MVPRSQSAHLPHVNPFSTKLVASVERHIRSKSSSHWASHPCSVSHGHCTLTFCGILNQFDAARIGQRLPAWSQKGDPQGSPRIQWSTSWSRKRSLENPVDNIYWNMMLVMIKWWSSIGIWGMIVSKSSYSVENIYDILWSSLQEKSGKSAERWPRVTHPSDTSIPKTPKNIPIEWKESSLNCSASELRRSRQRLTEEARQHLENLLDDERFGIPWGLSQKPIGNTIYSVYIYIYM